MFDKRGEMTTNEVIKMIIGIVILFFLIYLGVKLAGIVASNRDAEQAKVSFNELVYRIERLGVGSEDTFLIEGPKGWFVVANGTKICIFPSTCLENLPDRPGWRWDEDFAKDFNLFSVCTGSGFCKSDLNINVSMPHERLYYAREQGTAGVMYYSSWILKPFSNTYYVYFVNSFLIERVPVSFEIRRVLNGKMVEIIHVLQNERADFLREFLYNAKEVGIGERVSVDSSKFKDNYLRVSSNKRFLCICDSKSGDLSKCDMDGYCAMAYGLFAEEYNLKISENIFVSKNNKNELVLSI